LDNNNEMAASGILNDADHGDGTGQGLGLDATLEDRNIRIWMLQAMTSLDWRIRWRLAAKLLLPSPTYMRWRYNPQPDWLWPVFYPRRWWDITVDSFTTFVR
jgi:hypothetical protein